MNHPNARASLPEAFLLQAQPLDASAMAPYGWVLDIEQAFAAHQGQPINAGTSRRADLPGSLALDAQGGQPLVCVFRAQAQAARGPWHALERHRLGTQTFVPLADRRPSASTMPRTVCVLLVALGDESPDEHTLKAFCVNSQQAFTLKPGVWHHPLIALHDSDFLVVERAANQVDCEVRPLPRPMEVSMLAMPA
jgi:ureidoglycolate lyase